MPPRPALDPERLTAYNRLQIKAVGDVPFGKLLVEDHIPDADHILTGLQHQEYVVGQAVSWAVSTFGGATPAEEEAAAGGGVAGADAPIGHVVRSA